uniref:Major facilitator superfamily (MFS) profile domain-containing protein n=1 Tax=Strigamia maritima TaxID=126957 RepID=T1IYP4_STRMM
MLGSLIFGLLSDKYGRKTILVFILPLLSAVTIGCAFSPNFTTFLIIRFSSGFFSQVKAKNLTNSPKIQDSYILCNCFSDTVTLPLEMYLMYVLLNWRTLFLPESVTWLISKNKLDKSKQILEKFAQVNNLSIPETLDEDLKKQAQVFLHKQSKSSIQNYRILFCHSSLTRITLSIIYMMFTNYLVIGGLSFSISALEGSVYTNYLINGIIQLFTLAICLALFNWYIQAIGLDVSEYLFYCSLLVACYVLVDIF